MSKMFYSISLCLLLLVQFADGQIAKSKNTAAKPAVVKATDFPNLRAQAEEVGKATVAEDFEKLADLTHPQIAQMFGGKEKMVEYLKKGSAQMKSSGFELENIEIGEIQPPVNIGAEIFAIVPMKMTLKLPEGKFLGESSMVGISSDKGANWKFINAVSQEKFDKQFPKAAGKIIIPPTSPPRPIENE